MEVGSGALHGPLSAKVADKNKQEKWAVSWDRGVNQSASRDFYWLSLPTLLVSLSI